ncbi:hypothetical protein BC830DRAFT_48163 [Chytriomyces sp. MP71]|nr:hypothetical protein BC830DRAFT_48163 [Chytriomyces sp. MP71]
MISLCFRRRLECRVRGQPVSLPECRTKSSHQKHCFLTHDGHRSPVRVSPDAGCHAHSLSRGTSLSAEAGPGPEQSAAEAVQGERGGRSHAAPQQGGAACGGYQSQEGQLVSVLRKWRKLEESCSWTWGWVDVGFSHGIDDYDRTPIETDPLTKDGAIEVLQMRMEMRKVTQDLMRWREEYELALSGGLHEDGSSSSSSTSSFQDADEEDSATTDLESKPEVVLRRSQSSAGIRNLPTDTQSSSTSTRESSIANLLRKYPPTASPQASSKSSKHNSLYPHPHYPTHLLPRRMQSDATSLSTLPKKSQSTPVTSLSVNTSTRVPPPPIAIVTSPTSTTAPPIPVPRPRPQRGAGQSGILSWNVLDRPHSHVGTTSTPTAGNRAMAASPPVVASKLSSSSLSSGASGTDVAPPPAPRKRDAQFAANAAAAAASGARWTWNEALARDHKKEVDGQEGGQAPGGESKGVIGGLVGFWRGDKGAKEDK